MIERQHQPVLCEALISTHTTNLIIFKIDSINSLVSLEQSPNIHLRRALWAEKKINRHLGLIRLETVQSLLN